MFVFILKGYMITFLLELVANQKSVEKPVIRFDKMKRFMEPKLLSTEKVLKSPRFRKFFRGTLKLIFLSLLSFFLFSLLKKLFLLYNAFQEEQAKLLEEAGRKLIELVLKAAERLTDKMLTFLRDHNLENHLSREEWVDFFKEMLLGSTIAFQTLLREILAQAFKSPEFRVKSVEKFRKCILETPHSQVFPQLQDKRFWYALKKINKRYWKFSYFELEKYLKMLLEIYANSKFTNTQILFTIECIKRELEKRVNTPY